jgi:pullulanase
MSDSLVAFWRRAGVALMLFGLAFLGACGGGSTNFSNAPSGLEQANATDVKVVLNAVPAGGGGGGGANTVRLYYNRPDANYAGWTLYTYAGADLGGWPGKAPA